MYSLDSKKTYVIAGGTGGLGRAIATWMVKERGARNLLLLSRSGVQKKEAQEVVNDLREYGATVECPACDICDELALRTVLERTKITMPPIGGCVQASMVLRVSRLPVV
jgi:NAD(P)-dependent dehydrogenase (short-subunit alcohol dehydrogenase family)